MWVLCKNKNGIFSLRSAVVTTLITIELRVSLFIYILTMHLNYVMNSKTTKVILNYYIMNIDTEWLQINNKWRKHHKGVKWIKLIHRFRRLRAFTHYLFLCADDGRRTQLVRSANARPVKIPLYTKLAHSSHLDRYKYPDTSLQTRRKPSIIGTQYCQKASTNYVNV